MADQPVAPFEPPAQILLRLAQLGLEAIERDEQGGGLKFLLHVIPRNPAGGSSYLPISIGPLDRLQLADLLAQARDLGVTLLDAAPAKPAEVVRMDIPRRRRG